MSQSDRLPPGFVIRPAQKSDGWKVYQLALGKYFVLAFVCTTVIYLVGIAIALLRADKTLLNLLWLSFGFGILTVGSLWSYNAFIFLQTRKWMKYWLINNGQHTIALASVDRRDNFSLLNCLYVVPNYRRQGLGSHFLGQLSQRVPLPFYVTPAREKESFYRRLGFVPVSPQEKRYGTLVLR